MKSLILSPLYDTALEGLPLLGTPQETAARHAARPGSLRDRAAEMADVHVLLSASTGFVCGLGGFLTLPVTLPANVAGVALLQLHLCAATAALAAQDPLDPEVKARSLACLTDGDVEHARDEAQEVLDRSIVKIAERGLRLLAEVAVGTAEIAGRLGVHHALRQRLPRRALPLIGGFIGGASDLYATRRVARAARERFLAIELEPPRPGEDARGSTF